MTLKNNQMDKDNMNTELNNTDKKLHISDVRCMLFDFVVWLDRNKKYNDSNLSKNIDDFLKSNNYI